MAGKNFTLETFPKLAMNNQIKRRQLSPAFKTDCKRAGGPCGKKSENKIMPHDFRRTFKMNCVKAGIDLAWRNALFGHSQSGMDAHYIKPNEEDLQRAMDRYTRWLDGEMEKTICQSSDRTI
jgi:integrase